MNELALFAGAGGGILGGQLLGWRTICAVERDAYAAQVLAQRQNDGIFKPFPIWSDIKTFDGGPWAGRIDIISGGFPCQDISIAGKGKGIKGEKSGLWREMRRVVSEIRPYYAFIENSPILTIRGLERVICDLTALGYDTKWGVLGAYDLGAPHKRDRIWILATNTNCMPGTKQKRKHERPEDTKRCNVYKLESRNDLADTNRFRIQSGNTCRENAKNVREPSEYKGIDAKRLGWWSIEPRLDRVVNGMAYRVDRLKAIGNGQVPTVAAEAFIRLSGGIY